MSNDVSLLTDDRGSDSAVDSDSAVESGSTVDTERTVSELVRVLSRALRALGNNGHADAASQFAAQAWVLLRHEHPVDAERLSGLLHYLARLDPAPKDRPAAGPDAEPEDQQ